MKNKSMRVILASVLVLVLIVGVMYVAHVVQANRQAQNLRQEFFTAHPDAQTNETDGNALNQSRPLNGITSDMMNFVHNMMGIPTPEFAPH